MKIYSKIVNSSYGEGKPPIGRSWGEYMRSMEDLALQVERGLGLAEQYSRILSESEKRGYELSDEDLKFFKDALGKIETLYFSAKRKREEFSKMKRGFSIMSIYASLIKAKSNVNWDELDDVEVDLTGRAAWTFGSGGEGYDYFIGEYIDYPNKLVEDYLLGEFGKKEEVIVYGYHALMDVKSLNEIVVLVDKIEFAKKESDGEFYGRNRKVRIKKSFKVDWSWLLGYIDPGKEFMIKNGEFESVGTKL